MSRRFEELAWAETRMGIISLRRRFDAVVQRDVYEVKLDDEWLMSSTFTVAEIALARLALAEVADAGDGLDVIVGGLGLGHTAVTALEDPRVGTLTVIEALPEVIDWHRRELLPESARLIGDPRTSLVAADFFAAAKSETGFDPERPGRTYDAVIVDIDHTPRHVLDRSHTGFYTPAGLRALSRHLVAGGVFALWSDDPPEDDFLAVARQVFSEVRAEVVAFDNPLTGGTSTNTVYLAR